MLHMKGRALYIVYCRNAGFEIDTLKFMQQTKTEIISNGHPERNYSYFTHIQGKSRIYHQ